MLLLLIVVEGSNYSITFPLERIEQPNLGRRSLNSVTNNRIQLMAKDDYTYSAFVKVGNLKHKLVVDTGSSVLWLSKASLLQRPNIKKIDQIISIQYVVAQVKLQMAEMTVALGNMIAEMNVGIATSIKNMPSAIGGILGLGPPTHSSASVLQTMNIRNFSLFLSKEGVNERGWLTINNAQPSNYKGRFTFEPLSSVPATRWASNGHSIIVGGQEIRFPSPTPILFDSGKSLMSLDNSTAKQIARLVQGVFIPNTDFYKVSCWYQKNGPPISFKMSTGHIYTLQSSSYIVKIHSEIGCVLGFDITSEGHGFFTLGNLFLREFVSIFDVANNRIGFAPADHHLQ